MNKQSLIEFVTPIVAALNLEIDRVDIRSAGRRSLVQIFLDGDGEDGHGPSLDDIAAATRVISAALDDSNITGNGSYTLEISSRGVGRPLTEAKHFRRNIGRLVETQIAESKITGRILSADDHLQLDIDGETQTYSWDSVGQGYVQIEMNRDLPQE